MKKLLILLLVVLIIGGGALGALWKLKLPPFKPTAKKSEHAPIAQSKTDDPEAKGGTPPVTSELDQKAETKTIEDKSKKSELKPTDPKNSTAPLPGHAASTPEFSEANLTRLAGIYDQMPVEDVSKIFAKLTDPLAEALLRKMDEGKVSKLLPTFKPERSAALTLTLAIAKPPNEAAPVSR